MDRRRGLLAVPYRVYHHRRPVVRRVAAGEEALDVGPEGLGVDRDGLPPGEARRSLPEACVKPSSTGFWPIAETASWQGRSNSEPSSGTGRRLPDASGSPSFIRMQRSALSRLPSLTHADRRGQLHQLHALGQAILDLHLVGGHLGLGPPVEDDHLVRAEPPGGPGHVHRGVAAAHDHHRALDRVVVVGLLVQEVDPGDHALGVELALDPHRLGCPGAAADEDRVVALHQLVQGDVAADRLVVEDLHARPLDVLDLGVYHRVRQPVGRDAVAQHPARARLGLVDRRPCGPCGPGTRRRSAPPGPRRRCRRSCRSAPRTRAAVVSPGSVGDEALDRVDRRPPCRRPRGGRPPRTCGRRPARRPPAGDWPRE